MSFGSSATEPLEAATGTLSERIKASVTVLEFVSQYMDLRVCFRSYVNMHLHK
jgi:hypothetical protein